MKKHFKFLALLLLIASLVSSCEKDENKIYYEGGTAPVLKASSTSAMVLTIGNAANTAITFSWTNPDYRFTTGISSQDVTYILQVDTTGANFTNPAIQEVSVSKDLTKTFTVTELNTVLTKLNVAENKPHNIEFRLKSTLTNGSLPLVSNVIKIVITPYLDVAVPVPPTGELYITGSAMPSDWTNAPPASQKFTKLSNTEYTITVPFASGKEYKFLSTLSNWQPQYGTTNATGTELSGDMGYNMGGGSDPASIKTPSVAGSYKITVNFKTGKYTVVKQ